MKCRVRGCNNDATRKEAKLCNACYSFLNYWSGKTVTEKMRRIDKLQFWESRSKQLLLPSKVAKIKIGSSS